MFVGETEKTPMFEEKNELQRDSFSDIKFARTKKNKNKSLQIEVFMTRCLRLREFCAIIHEDCDGKAM